MEGNLMRVLKVGMMQMDRWKEVMANSEPFN